MNLTIDNLQGQGPEEYTAGLDGTKPPVVGRKLNQPAELQFSLVANSPGFVIPVAGARVVLARADGSFMFTGYVTGAPQYEYLGWGEQAPVYRYNAVAQSDELLLNQKALPNRAAFVDRSAGSALRQLAQDLLPDLFNTAAVQNVDTLPTYAVNAQESFSFHAAEIALAARASFRTMNGALILAPVGTATHALNESDANFSPEGLWLNSPNLLANELTVIGQDEPQAYVRDYFAGDRESLKFYLSQEPFAQAKPALIDEEYLGPGLDPTTWVVNDPSSAVSIVAQTLQIAGGTGVDGQTTVSFFEQIELGGALELQHGDVSFTAASQGVLGGLYAGAISAAGCLAGFQITPSGWGPSIQAVIGGSATGPVMATTPGHQYFFTTYVYSMEVYRSGETYYSSSLHPAGSGWGGAAVAADVRFVLEVQDIDPSNPETLVAPATVLYDNVVTDCSGILYLCFGECGERGVQHRLHVCGSHIAGGSENRFAQRELRDATCRRALGWSSV